MAKIMTGNNNVAEKVLKASVSALKRSENGENIDDTLDELSNEKIRSICTDLLFGYYRNKAFIDHLISLFTDKVGKNTPAKYRQIIAVALTQALFQTGIISPIAVDLAVSFAKKKYGKKISGFVNAVLRKCLLQDLDEIRKTLPELIRLNLPEVVFSRWKKFLGYDRMLELSEICSEIPLMTFRLIGNINDDELIETGCEPIDLPEWGSEYKFYSVSDPKRIFAKNWLQEGLIYIQDPSTVSPCSFYQSSSRDLVIDMCSAPGGKSLVLAKKIDKGMLISADRSWKRQLRTIENFTRIGGKVEIIVASVTASPFRSESADVVLLDVPCSNTGVIRRRPDVPWNFSLGKLHSLVEIQAKMLDEGARIVKAGGSLIYSTCSIEPEENDRQMKQFLKTHSDFRIEHERQLLPNRLHDGGYAALLRKQR